VHSEQKVIADVDTRESVSAAGKWDSCPDHGLVRGPTLLAFHRELLTPSQEAPAKGIFQSLPKFPSGARIAPLFAALQKHI